MKSLDCEFAALTVIRLRLGLEQAEFRELTIGEVADQLRAVELREARPARMPLPAIGPRVHLTAARGIIDHGGRVAQWNDEDAEEQRASEIRKAQAYDAAQGADPR